MYSWGALLCIVYCRGMYGVYFEFFYRLDQHFLVPLETIEHRTSFKSQPPSPSDLQHRPPDGVAVGLHGRALPIQDIRSLVFVCARINHPFITPAHLHYPHYCNTTARLLRNLRCTASPTGWCRSGASRPSARRTQPSWSRGKRLTRYCHYQ